MAVKIALPSGPVALVDDIDADLADLHWNIRTNGRCVGYAVRYNSEKKQIKLHVVILERKLNRSLSAEEQTDHINGNTLDNRRHNLRSVNGSQQAINRRKISTVKGKSPSSKYKGVSWEKYHNKWKAYIKYGKHKYHLLYTTSEIEAALAYDKKARELYGEFAKTNF